MLGISSEKRSAFGFVRERCFYTLDSYKCDYKCIHKYKHFFSKIICLTTLISGAAHQESNVDNFERFAIRWSNIMLSQFKHAAFVIVNHCITIKYVKAIFGCQKKNTLKTRIVLTNRHCDLALRKKTQQTVGIEQIWVTHRLPLGKRKW